MVPDSCRLFNIAKLKAFVRNRAVQLAGSICFAWYIPYNFGQTSFSFHWQFLSESQNAPTDYNRQVTLHTAVQASAKRWQPIVSNYQVILAILLTSTGSETFRLVKSIEPCWLTDMSQKNLKKSFLKSQNSSKIRCRYPSTSPGLRAQLLNSTLQEGSRLRLWPLYDQVMVVLGLHDQTLRSHWQNQNRSECEQSGNNQTVSSLYRRYKILQYSVGSLLDVARQLSSEHQGWASWHNIQEFNLVVVLRCQFIERNGVNTKTIRNESGRK